MGTEGEPPPPQPESPRPSEPLTPRRSDDPNVGDPPQDRSWSQHAKRYEEMFLDPFAPGVINPLMDALDRIPEPQEKTAIDLGCGTGPLLPYLAQRFGRVLALDFAPGMLDRARERLLEASIDAEHVEFLNRSMEELDDLVDACDLAVAVNSLVMPDIFAIDRSLQAIRNCLTPQGHFLGILPAMDAIHYHTMLLYDHALNRGMSTDEARAWAAFNGEHEYYDFAFGYFKFEGLFQKFWQPFEIEYYLGKAQLELVALDKVGYPWDDSVPGGELFRDQHRSWDWVFTARPRPKPAEEPNTAQTTDQPDTPKSTD